MKSVEKKRLKPLVSEYIKNDATLIIKEGIIEEIRARLPNPVISFDPRFS
jgi:hypothetical protein